MLVGNMLVLVDVQYYTQHSRVASIQRLLQGGLQGPEFTAIKEYRLHACLVAWLDCHTVVMPFRALYASAFLPLGTWSRWPLPEHFLLLYWEVDGPGVCYKWGPQFSLHSAWGPPCYCKVLCVVFYLSIRKNNIWSYFTSNRRQWNTELAKA